MMTKRQLFLKAAYPFLAMFNKLFKKNMEITNPGSKAQQSFYNLEMNGNNGKPFDFHSLKNKKVLVVNTASDCGYTPQYDGLQRLYDKYKGELVILGFPANDFGEQEKGDDQSIGTFCKINFGVTFPLMAKSTVIKAADQNAVFQWLTNKEKNGWNDKAPGWNFYKYLVDETGNLTHVFEAAVEPDDAKIVAAIDSV